MHKYFAIITVFSVAALMGCQQQPSNTAEETSAAASTVDGSRYVLSSEPEGAQDVIALRESSTTGDDVVMVGRIGGSANPWIEGRAAFSLVDNSLQACNDIPGDSCKKPWDYCCETTKLPTATALVKMVDEDGQVVAADARELLGVKELSTVVVHGKAQRDDAGNLTVLADGVYIAQK